MRYESEDRRLFTWMKTNGWLINVWSQRCSHHWENRGNDSSFRNIQKAKSWILPLPSYRNWQHAFYREPNVTNRSFILFGSEQRDNEGMEQFFRALSDLAKGCDFDPKEESIRLWETFSFLLWSMKRIENSFVRIRWVQTVPLTLQWWRKGQVNVQTGGWWCLKVRTE